MRSPPERVDEAVITTALAAGWGLSIVVLRDVPLGAGAYQKGRPHRPGSPAPAGHGDRAPPAMHRLLWAMSDLASSTAQLRGGHRRNADAERGLTALHSVLDGGEPAPDGAPYDRPAPPT